MKNYISLLFLIMICVETAHSQDKLFEKSYFFDLDTAFNQKITGIKKILQQGEFIYVVAEIGHQDVNGVTDEVFFS